MAGVNKEDFDRLHEKVDRNGETLARIEGKLDERKQGDKDWYARLGVIGTFIALVWTAFKTKVGA